MSQKKSLRDVFHYGGHRIRRLSGHIVFIVRRWGGRDGGQKEREGERRERQRKTGTQRETETQREWKRVDKKQG